MASRSIKVMRESPSSKARRISSTHLQHLMHLLYMLDICGWYGVSYEYNKDNYEDEVDWKAWREWVIRHTPPHKRGGPSN